MHLYVETHRILYQGEIRGRIVLITKRKWAVVKIEEMFLNTTEPNYDWLLRGKKGMEYNKTTCCFSIIALPILLSGCASPSNHPIAMSINQDMVLVEGGEFTMGSDSKTAAKSERPAHPVRVDSFYLSKFEVTQELFESSWFIDELLRSA